LLQTLDTSGISLATGKSFSDPADGMPVAKEKRPGNGRLKNSTSSSEEKLLGRGASVGGALLTFFAALVTLLPALVGLAFSGLAAFCRVVILAFRGGRLVAGGGLGKRQAASQQHGENDCQKLLHAISFKGKFRMTQSNPILRKSFALATKLITATVTSQQRCGVQ
jgi:hypothetical protein